MSTIETNIVPSTVPGSSRTMYKLLALLLLAGALAYSNSMTKPFVLDDILWISNNDVIKDLGEYSQVMSTRTVVALTLHLNYRVHGFNVFGYHLFNVAIHLMASLALFGVVRRTLLLPRWQGRFDANAHWFAFAIALLWTVHPLQTQAVTYTIQRGESMMGLFFLLSLYLLIRGSQSQRGWAWYLASLASFLVGANCKEVMITYLPVALCYDVILLGSIREMLRRRWWYYVLIASYWAFILSGVASSLDETAGGSAGFALPHLKAHVYWMSQAGIVLHYLRLAIIPYPQAFSYRGWAFTTDLAEFWPAGIPMIVLILATAWLMLRRHWVGFLGAWFFGILSITSIVPLIDIGFEHRMYLPIAAVCALAVFGAYFLISKWNAGRLGNLVCFALLAVAATTLLVLTMRRNEDYRSASVLWRTVYEIFPNDVEAINNSANDLIGESKFDEAQELYEKGLNRAPMYLLEMGYGRLLCRRDRPKEGLVYLKRGLDRLTHTPFYPMRIAAPNYHIGIAHWALDEKDSASTYFQKAMEYAPQKDFLIAAVAMSAVEQNRPDEARRLYEEALRLNPKFVEENLRKADLQLHRVKLPSDWSRKEALFYALQAAQADEFKTAKVISVLADAYAANQMYGKAIKVTQDHLGKYGESLDRERQILFQRALTQYHQRQKNANEKKDKK